MEKARTLIVTTTAWLSFLAALWTYFFRILPWQAPFAMGIVVVVVFGLAAVPKK